MTLEASVHAFRLRVIARAQALGNVSQACREFGISRTLFYRWRRRYLAYGPDGLYPKRPGPSRGRPPTLSVEAERALLAVALAHPTWGPARIGAHLARPEHGGWNLAPATIYRFLRRVGLQTRYKRLAVLEVHSAQTAGLLTDRTRRALSAARRRRPRHVAAEQPGELVCLDTFYVGKLKGVGKVWQYTACDAACSYAVAQVSTEFSAQAAARFLTARVLPVYRAAGWLLRRVLTDCGSEYRPSLCRLRNPAYPHPASSRLEGRLRRAPAGHHPHRAVAAGSSPTCGPCRPPWTGTWSSTTTAGPTRATEPGAARLPSCSGESRRGKIMIRRQTHEVYTPFRYWTY
jgi:transposase